MIYLFYFVIAFCLAALITPLVKRLALHFGILDVPNQARKMHPLPTPVLGGVAIYLSFILGLLIYFKFGEPDFYIVPLKFFCGIIFGGAVLIIGGVLDDRLNLPPKILWLFPALASLIVVWSGIGVGITQISNPFGSLIFIGYNFQL